MKIDSEVTNYSAMVAEHGKCLMRIAQLNAALIQIRDEAATMNNGGAWAAGLATLCLATLPK